MSSIISVFNNVLAVHITKVPVIEQNNNKCHKGKLEPFNSHGITPVSNSVVNKQPLTATVEAGNSLICPWKQNFFYADLDFGTP